MFSRVLKPIANVATQNGAKNFSVSSQMNYKVTVAGAAGGIGQPLSLLLKLNPLVSHLALYDVAPVTNGVATDLSHMNTCSKVTGHLGVEAMDEAMKDADVVVIPAGVPRKPGMTRDDLFNTNATIVCNVVSSIAKVAPNAVIAIITNPVNSMVPIAAEVMKKHCVHDPKRIVGVTTLDVVRASAFIGEINKVDPTHVKVPVIGGHAGATIIPVLSQAEPKVNLSDQKDIEALTVRIQEAGTEVVKAKAGGGSATLSMAYAGARISGAILKGLNGEKNVVECAYVQSEVTDAPFFANPVQFGKCGIEKNLGYGTLNKYEEKLLKEAVPALIKNYEKALDFVKQYVNKA